MVQERAFADVTQYHWLSEDQDFSGDLQSIAKDLKHPLQGTGRLTEFKFIAYMIKQGWNIKAVESRHAHMAPVLQGKYGSQSRETYKPQVRLLHFTKVTP